MTPNQTAKIDRLVWVDCEMTGLDTSRHVLVEIAVVVTDAELKPLDKGIDIVIHATEDELAEMDDFVTKMHGTSGLTEEIRQSTVSVADAEKQVVAYIRQFVASSGVAPLCGNSIASDRKFIAKYMPDLDNFLHYRMIDVSSIKELARRWYQKVYYNQPPKGMAHRALADIVESIRELDYYRRTVFVDVPGPASPEAQEAKQASTDAFQEHFD